jgi:hypothetical protein
MKVLFWNGSGPQRLEGNQLAAAGCPTQGRAGGALIGKGPDEIGPLRPLGHA